MTRYLALLRAVNVGGTGKLPMRDLVVICEEAGFEDVRTYIASGNVVFSSGAGEEAVRRALEDRLQAYAGKPVGVILRDQGSLAQVLADSPFADRDPRRAVVIFLNTPPPGDAVARATGRASEEMALGAREIHVFYPDEQGRSKLRIPAAALGTARNLNTVTALAAMLAEQ